MTMDLNLLTVVRLTCDRCAAIAEATEPGAHDARKFSFQFLLSDKFPDWQSRNDNTKHLCPDCAASYKRWLDDGKNVVHESNNAALTQLADVRQAKHRNTAAER